MYLYPTPYPTAFYSTSVSRRETVRSILGGLPYQRAKRLDRIVAATRVAARTLGITYDLGMTLLSWSWARACLRRVGQVPKLLFQASQWMAQSRGEFGPCPNLPNRQVSQAPPHPSYAIDHSLLSACHCTTATVSFQVIVVNLPSLDLSDDCH